MKCRASCGFSSIFLIALMASFAWAGEPAEAPATELPVVKLTPKVRGGSRGQDWFEHLSCAQAASTTAATADEARWLEARKQACVQQYQGHGHGSVR